MHQSERESKTRASESERRPLLPPKSLSEPTLSLLRPLARSEPEERRGRRETTRQGKIPAGGSCQRSLGVVILTIVLCEGSRNPPSQITNR
eukprot:scaffold235918_cov35-Tisochrysis_lutea.AAC.1